MGYFKKLKERKRKERLDAVLEIVTMQAKGTRMAVNHGVLDAINIFDDRKYQYEDNLRFNIEQLIEHGGIDKLVEEVAKVIDTQAKVYGYRIAKDKRTELAQDILVALSVKK